MKRYLVLLCFFASIHVLCQEAKLTGAWHVEGMDHGMLKSELVFVQGKTDLAILTKAEDKKWKLIGNGSVTNNRVTLLFTNDQTVSYELISEGKKLRSASIDSSGDVTGTFLSSLYLCGNHAPTNHAATNLREMKTLSEQLHCAGWHSSRDSDATQGRLVEALVSNPAAP